ncbi:MAG: hypothetical protein E7503_07340 [Ruminococcus sp.]|nr:hypothetical protein [Ruminococcus sp.]
MKQKRMIACLLASAMLLPTGISALPALADDPADSAADSTTGTDSDDDEEVWVDRTEEEVLQKMKIVAENDNLALYAWDEDKVDEDNDEKPEDVFALKNKKNGYIWWSSPINAAGDSIATPVLAKGLSSGLILTAAEIDDRSTTTVRSGDTSKTSISYKSLSNGIEVTYNYRKVGIKIPVRYELGEDYLQVTIDSSDITEKYGPDHEEGPVLTQALSMLNAFGAAGSDEDGYFVIPDGSGALINFNNRKYSAKTYNQPIYGKDVTAVPKTKGAVTEGISLPMYGIVKGENALLAVATSGDGNCNIKAAVSGTGQSNTEYNICYFEFVTRSADEYYLGNDQLTPLAVYQENMPQVTMQARYYPLCTEDEVNADGGKELDYVDIAARYREYLLEDEGVQVKAQANSALCYVDVYGGTMKQRNILGFPVFMKTSMTSYEETQKILEQLKTAGAENLVVSMNNWTNAGISGKVDYKAKPSGTLGGKSDFNDLVDYMNGNSVQWFPTVNNYAYYSGAGYFSLTDTAVRVSGSFARIVDYERAYGVPYGEKKTMSLLSPSTFTELYEKLAKNYKKAGLTSVSIGEMSSLLYGDYGKKSATSREQTMQAIENSLSTLRTEVGTVLSQDPNAYVLPYTDTITDIPLYSSGFDILDEDIPLYQMVLHGVIPYSTRAVNGSADAERLVMLALASGSNLRFDMLYAETSELKDTDFDIYYYGYYEYWVENAAQYYQFTKDILAKTSDSYIVSYVQEDDVISTTYANGVKTVVDLANCSVSIDGETRYLRDYVEEGDVVFE